MKPYYYIFRVGGSHPRGKRGNVKYLTMQEADAEAMRLAGQHPGDTFEILKCIGIVRATTPQAFWMDGVIPPPSPTADTESTP